MSDVNINFSKLCFKPLYGLIANVCVGMTIISIPKSS